jgi:hypothetical protein
MIRRRSSSTTIFFHALPGFAVRWAVATPVIAILQGALLLYGTMKEALSGDADFFYGSSSYCCCRAYGRFPILQTTGFTTETMQGLGLKVRREEW